MKHFLGPKGGREKKAGFATNDSQGCVLNGSAFSRCEKGKHERKATHEMRNLD